MLRLKLPANPRSPPKFGLKSFQVPNLELCVCLTRERAQIFRIFGKKLEFGKKSGKEVIFLTKVVSKF